MSKYIEPIRRGHVLNKQTWEQIASLKGIKEEKKNKCHFFKVFGIGIKEKKGFMCKVARIYHDALKAYSPANSILINSILI